MHMSQVQKVKQAILYGKKTISEITDFTQILRPNIRRILGEGTIKGTFKREGKGVYTLTDAKGQQRAYIEVGKAEETLPRLVSEGRKFNTVFLDIPYFSQALAIHPNGNRGIKNYDFLLPGQFADVAKSISELMATDDSHIYLMLSGARTAQKDMQKYLFAALESGLQYVQEGKYLKTFKNGQPVTNVRGQIAAPERLILLTKSGKVRSGELADVKLNIEAIRPSINTSYSTEKAESLCDQLILQSTFPGEHTLDPCAGSGIFGLRSVILNRFTHMIEALEDTINNFLLPRFISPDLQLF